MQNQSSFDPPYYAVIFISRFQEDATLSAYLDMAEEMEKLAAIQKGFLSIESIRGNDGCGMTISYWSDLEAIQSWKSDLEHQTAQQLGKSQWYQSYSVQIARIEKSYSWNSEN